MNLTFTTELPIGESNTKIVEVIRRELILIRQRNLPSLGNEESVNSDDLNGSISYSFNGSAYGTSGGTISIGKKLITLELRVPDCNPFRFVIAQNFIKTFEVIKVPQNATV